MPHIIYIHGANATPKSFSYLAHNLQPHTAHFVVYDAGDDLGETIKHTAQIIDQPCHIVCHSLGGVIGVAAAQYADNGHVQSITTISTPFGGSEAADRMRYVLPFNSFFRNIRTTNPLFKAIQKSGPPAPTLTIVTNGGQSPFEPKPNDGVVTVESQMAFNGTHLLHAPYTHFEVLMDSGIASVISEFIASNGT